MEKLKDEQLVEEYLKGNKQALEFLLERYFVLLYNFILRSIKNREIAEDLAQEVVIKVWKNLKKFDLEKSFKTWIYRIARNTIIDYVRKKKDLVFSQMSRDNEEELEFSETIADDELSPLLKLERADLNRELEEALGKLSIADRTLLLLYHNQNITFREIAEISSESLDAIKSRYRRALLKLRKILLDKTDSQRKND